MDISNSEQLASASLSLKRPVSRRFVLSVFCLALSFTVGCQQEKKQPSASEQAQKDWNAARAGVLVNLAKEQYQNASFDKCRQTINDALKLMPASEPLHVMSARVAIEQGQPEAAERELQVARQLSPSDAEPLYLSGVVYQRWQKPDTACDFYRQAAEKAPAELSYVLAEAEMLVVINRSNDALELLSAKVNYFEHSGAIRDAVGQLLMQQGRFHEAADMLREASILSEDDNEIHERLGRALYRDKQYRECAEVIGRLVEKETLSRRADLFGLLGECRLQMAQPRDARMSFETAAQLDDASPHIWQCLGRASLETGDFRRAAIALSKSISLDGTIGETHLLLGYVRLRQNRFAEALASFQSASAADRSDTVSLCMAGYAMQKMGDNESARNCYATALKINPNDEMATQLMSGMNPHD